MCVCASWLLDSCTGPVVYLCVSQSVHGENKWVTTIAEIMDSPRSEAFGMPKEILIFKLLFVGRFAERAANLPSSAQVCMLTQRGGIQQKH